MVPSKENTSSYEDQSIKTFDSKGRLTVKKKKSANHNKEEKRSAILRLVLILALIAAIGVCSSLAYIQLHSTEVNVGIQTYQSIAMSATNGAKSITERKFQGSEVMSTLLGEIYPNESDWPFVSMQGYISIAQKVASLSSSGTQAFMILVDPSQARDFETHIQQQYVVQGRPEHAGVSDFGFGVWRRDGNETKTFEDGRIQDMNGENAWGGKSNKMAVLAMHNVPAASSLMFNIYTEKNRGVHIDSIYNCVMAHDNATTSPFCPVVTDMLTLVVRDAFSEHLTWAIEWYPMVTQHGFFILSSFSPRCSCASCVGQTWSRWTSLPTHFPQEQSEFLRCIRHDQRPLGRSLDQCCARLRQWINLRCQYRHQCVYLRNSQWQTRVGG